jgi:hypothetical protein
MSMDLPVDDERVLSHIIEGYDLVGYAGGTAEVEDQRLVEAHLVTCEPCAEAVDELRVTLILLEASRER